MLGKSFSKDDELFLKAALDKTERQSRINALSRRRTWLSVYLILGVMLFVLGESLNIILSQMSDPAVLVTVLVLLIWVLKLDYQIKLLKLAEHLL